MAACRRAISRSANAFDILRVHEPRASNQDAMPDNDEAAEGRSILIARQVLWAEQTDLDRLVRLLRVDDHGLIRLNVHQLIFDLLLRFQ